jgi:type IV pilus assembly protein PilV
MHLSPRRTRRFDRKAIKGATLLEVLIAILLLAIGLLGVSGLHAASLRFVQGGWARAAVAAGMSSLAESVRSNPDASTTAYLLTDTYDQQRKDIGTKTESTSCTTATCLPSELAAAQLNNWRIALDKSMPGAAGFVTGDRSLGYQVTVMWFDRSFTQKNSSGVEVPVPNSCSGTEAGLAQRTCCPAAAATPAGTRCTSFTVVP